MLRTDRSIDEQDPDHCGRSLRWRDIVRALTPVAGKFDKHDDHFENDQYVVSSAVGHLVEIAAPEAFDVKRGKRSLLTRPSSRRTSI